MKLYKEELMETILTFTPNAITLDLLLQLGLQA